MIHYILGQVIKNGLNYKFGLSLFVENICFFVFLVLKLQDGYCGRTHVCGVSGYV